MDEMQNIVLFFVCEIGLMFLKNMAKYEFIFIRGDELMKVSD